MVQYTLYMGDGDVLNCVNDSGTTAISAGDIVYFSRGTTTDIGTTAPTKLQSTYLQVKTSRSVNGTTAAKLGKKVAGVALSDAAALGYVPVATKGIFFSKVEATTCPIYAGSPLKLGEGTATFSAYNALERCGTTTPVLAESLGKAIGIALTGSSANDGNYVAWLLDAASRKN